MRLKDFDFRIWNNNSRTYEAKSITEALGFITLVFSQLTYENPLIDYEIELFTGVCDKNGNKIYEGDIVYNDDRIGVIVRRYYGEFRLEFEKDNSLGLKVLHESNLSIVGNIHENMDLLKK